MTANKFCDCAQGRWPCTCMPRYSIEQQAQSHAIDDAARARELRASAEYWAGKLKSDDRTADLVDKNNSNAEEFDFVLNGPTIAQLIKDGNLSAYEAKMTRVGYWREQATGLRALLRGKCAEFDALNARLQVYRGVAVIGWAGFILVLLGV